MERRLNEVEWSTTGNASSSTGNSGNNGPVPPDLFAGNEDLSVEEKDRIIQTLESQVEAQVLDD